MAESLSGKLLVATPELVDPNFARSVVLLVEYSEDEGAFGIVLDQPTEIPVADYLEEWAPYAADPAVVFRGGPVSPEVAIGLADSPGSPLPEWKTVTGGVGLVDLGVDPAEVGGVLRCRAYSGYAGWAPGQLEEEIGTGSWFVVNSTPDDIYAQTPDQLWRDVLHRQEDIRSWYAHYPDHPLLN